MRFYFHVLNSQALIDTEGTELPSIEEARRQAVLTAGQVMASEGEQFWVDGRWLMSVADDTGKIVLTLDFHANTHER